MAGITVRRGEGETLNVLGMPLRFLCDAHETAGAWSLMEEDIPIGHGPPPHRHDWDEAYYVISGALQLPRWRRRLCAEPPARSTVSKFGDYCALRCSADAGGLWCWQVTFGLNGK